MTAHSWEQRQIEKAHEAAAETVSRLERALAEIESELDFRREALGQIVAERHARGARLIEAHERGARFVFGGASGAPNVAEASWPDAPAAAVQTLAQHVAEAPRLHADETSALVAVDTLERRVHATRRHLVHWQAVAGTDAPSSDSGPVACAPTVPPTAPEAETAEAAAMTESRAHAALSSPPASGSLRERLAGLAERVAAW